MSAGRLPSASALLRKSEETTGLSDWGGDLFRKPFEVLISDLNSESQLHELGARRAERRLFDTLCARLRLVADRKRFPAIAQERIERPIIVIGLPRSGTTFFHNLLSADAANRSPATWEIMLPSPPPTEADYETDSRIADAEAAMAYVGFMDETLQAIHPFNSRRPEECNFIWELSFLTVNYMAWWNVPNYRELLYSIDFCPVYQEHRQVLQHLQHRRRRDRWVLKTPAHMAWLADLFAVYPDACLVQCHRDPAKIIPSLSNNLVVWRRTFSDVVPKSDFGMLELQAAGLANVARFREQPQFRDRFFDAHYLEVQTDPIVVLKRAYSAFGVAFDPTCEAAVKDWVREDREGYAKGSKHAYRLDDYGLDYAAIDRVMGDYIRAFCVQLER